MNKRALSAPHIMRLATAFFNIKIVTHCNEGASPSFSIFDTWEVLRNFLECNATGKAAICLPATIERI